MQAAVKLSIAESSALRRRDWPPTKKPAPKPAQAADWPINFRRVDFRVISLTSFGSRSLSFVLTIESCLNRSLQWVQTLRSKSRIITLWRIVKQAPHIDDAVLRAIARRPCRITRVLRSQHDTIRLKCPTRKRGANTNPRIPSLTRRVTIALKNSQTESDETRLFRIPPEQPLKHYRVAQRHEPTLFLHSISQLTRRDNNDGRVYRLRSVE